MNIDLFGPASAPGAVTVRPSESRSFGAADTFFKDCSSPDLDDGTEFQAATFNQWLANMRAIVRANGQTGAGADVVTYDNADDNLLLKAMLQLMQRNQPNYAADTGTADALAVAPSPAFAEYKAGMRLLVKKSAADNATTAPVINVSGLGNIPVVDRRGNVLAKGDLPASAILDLEFDGTSARMLGVVSADLAALRSLTNVKQFSTSTRVHMAGAAGNAYTVNPWNPGNYVKQSPTSLLMIWATFPTFTDSPTGSAQGTLNVGGTPLVFIPSNNNSALSFGQGAIIQTLAGIGAGSLALSLTFQRNDSTAWTGSFCFNGSDSASYPAATTATIIMGELGV